MFGHQNYQVLERLKKDIDHLENRLSELRTTLYGINREISRIENNQDNQDRLNGLKNARAKVIKKINETRQDKYLVVSELKSLQK
jgi:chromosome segregation ATPase